MRRQYLLLTVAAAVLISLAACGSATTAGSASLGGGVGSAQASGLGVAVARVDETNALTFFPASVTVHVGEVIQWTNAGSIPHNVMFDAHPTLTSPLMMYREIWQATFTTKGTYPYRCSLHPGMDGTITVE